jgi:hypothetical protein
MEPLLESLLRNRFLIEPQRLARISEESGYVRIVLYAAICALLSIPVGAVLGLLISSTLSTNSLVLSLYLAPISFFNLLIFGAGYALAAWVLSRMFDFKESFRSSFAAFVYSSTLPMVFAYLVLQALVFVIRIMGGSPFGDLVCALLALVVAAVWLVNLSKGCAALNRVPLPLSVILAFSTGIVYLSILFEVVVLLAILLLLSMGAMYAGPGGM